MIFLILYIFSAVSAVGLGGLAAYSDYRGMTIPNRYAVLIACCFVAAYGAAHGAGAALFGTLGSHLLSAVLTLLVTFIFFTLRIMGGGDSKLATAFAFWMPAAAMPVFLFYMSLFGGIFALLSIVFRKWKPFKAPRPGGWIARVQAGENAVPYGIPIVMGAVLSFAILGYFAPDRLGLFLGVSE